MKENEKGSEALRYTLECLTPSVDKIYILTDSNVETHIADYISICEEKGRVYKITVPPGERSKSIERVVSILSVLTESGATRRSLLINIGGGVVTDLGGFAASVFKRGIRTINVATSLLAAVDAAIGGKTGVDFMGLKNEVGSFHMPIRVIVATELLSSLPEDQLREGYAELVKTLMLADRKRYIKSLDMEGVCKAEKELGELVGYCARYKEKVVAEDPCEKGKRRILNLGHTFGHAFESLTGVGHGTAVAHGLLCTLIASRLYIGLSSEDVYIYKEFLRENYNSLPIGCKDCERIIELMMHDKKNEEGGYVKLILLRSIGGETVEFRADRRQLETVLEAVVG